VEDLFEDIRVSNNRRGKEEREIHGRIGGTRLEGDIHSISQLKKPA
jgi:hypothetical protein